MIVTDPVITLDADGFATVDYPDPPRASYMVAHEVIEQWVDTFNELARLRRWKAEAVQVLAEWDEVADLLDAIVPPVLGRSRAAHAADTVAAILAQLDAMRATATRQ